MGARPLFALNMVSFPRETLALEVLGEIVRGGGTRYEAGSRYRRARLTTRSPSTVWWSSAVHPAACWQRGAHPATPWC